MEEVCYGFPFILRGRHWNDLLTIFSYYGICNFWDDADDTGLPNSKSIHQTLVVIPSSKVSQCDRQLQTWFERCPLPGIWLVEMRGHPLCHFSIHLWIHPEEVTEAVVIFILQLLDKPLILAKDGSSKNPITCPPSRRSLLSALLGRNLLNALLLNVDGIYQDSLDVEMVHHQTVQHNLSFRNVGW